MHLDLMLNHKFPYYDGRIVEASQLNTGDELCGGRAEIPSTVHTVIQRSQTQREAIKIEWCCKDGKEETNTVTSDLRPLFYCELNCVRHHRNHSHEHLRKMCLGGTKIQSGFP